VSTEVLVAVVMFAAFMGGVVGALLGAIVVLHDWPFHIVGPHPQTVELADSTLGGKTAETSPEPKPTTSAHP
jgi:hypothetical protein